MESRECYRSFGNQLSKKFQDTIFSSFRATLLRAKRLETGTQNRSAHSRSSATILFLISATMPQSFAQGIPVTTGKKQFLPYSQSADFVNEDSKAFVLPILAVHRSKDDNECASSMFTNGAKTTYEDRIEDAKEQKIVYGIKPTIQISGIRSVTIDGPLAKVELDEFAFHKEYSADIKNVIRKTHYEARPGTALLAQTFTLGLGLLFAPKMSALQIVGCNDYKLFERNIDLTTMKFTGSYMLKPSYEKQRILVTGIGEKPLEVELKEYSGSGYRVATFDLSENIKAQRLSGPIPLVVECLTCTSLSDGELNEWKLISAKSTVQADFLQVQAKFDNIEKQRMEKEQKLAEQLAREKLELERQKAAEAERAKRELQLELKKKQQREQKDQIFKL